jgi:hypothetical protein
MKVKIDDYGNFVSIDKSYGGEKHVFDRRLLALFVVITAMAAPLFIYHKVKQSSLI